ncbi:hypothetical protein QAD02_002316 [Eretmocerus hayati]|uniref:Uncharacterized protein n=1 Tax=Eretmocerus hayati TaxID=131215 RepID=A0ACC2NIY0_9HYME|nr:hypothetical protein QAD02_002316 [Eretmocerus hayati]
MTVMDPSAPRPHLIVFDVPSERLAEGLIEEIRGRNFPELALELLRDQVQVVTSVSQKEAGLTNVVIKVCSEMRERMLNMGQMYVGWMSCKVKESVNVPRCWRYMEFGYGIDECKKRERLCRRCGRPGHLIAACRDAGRCVNCAKKPESRNLKHSAMSPNCPEYKWRADVVRER